MRFHVGDHVRISNKYHWAQGATGVITDPPDFAKQLAGNDYPWQDSHHFVRGVKRMIEFYWVWFDEPQIDADGDGPYQGAEIPVEVIERSVHV